MARELWIKQFDMVCVKTGEVLMKEPQMLNLEHAAEELGVPVVGVDDEEVTLLVDCGCCGHSVKCGVYLQLEDVIILANRRQHGKLTQTFRC